MQRLLRESEFANIHKQQLCDFVVADITPMNEAFRDIRHYGYSSPNVKGYVARIKVKNNKLLSLEINNHVLANEFIKVYCIEPYTYSFYCKGNIMCDIGKLQPFTYSSLCRQIKSLPKCIISKEYGAKTHFRNKQGSKFIYLYTKKLQDELPVSNRYLTTKSARK